MKKILLAIFILLIISIKPALAQEDFAVSANDYYEIEADGTASAKKNFQIVNLSTNVYPSTYVLQAPTDAYDIFSFDGEGKIEPEIKDIEEQRQIVLTLNEIRPGVEQAVNFAVQYKSKKIAFLEDGSWKIVIPSETANTQFIEHNIKVSFPDSWGEPSLIKPIPKEKYVWTTEEITDSPIVISFKSQGDLNSKDLLTTEKKQDDHRSIIIGVVLGLFITAILFFIVKSFHNKSYQKNV